MHLQCTKFELLIAFTGKNRTCATKLGSQNERRKAARDKKLESHEVGSEAAAATLDAACRALLDSGPDRPVDAATAFGDARGCALAPPVSLCCLWTPDAAHPTATVHALECTNPLPLLARCSGRTTSYTAGWPCPKALGATHGRARWTPGARARLLPLWTDV